jgi:hypothetical protein
MQVIVQFCHLYDLLEGDQPDTFAWNPTPDSTYSVASAYGTMFLGSSSSLGAKQIWKVTAPLRVKFFFW